MHIVDLIVFLLFTGGIVLFGCSFFNKKASSEEFTSAGRSLPGWVVGMSIFATYVSSISYLGYPGKAFAGDWNAFVFSLSIPIASYFAAKYFVPFYRSQGSVPETHPSARQGRIYVQRIPYFSLLSLYI